MRRRARGLLLAGLGGLSLLAVLAPDALARAGGGSFGFGGGGRGFGGGGGGFGRGHFFFIPVGGGGGFFLFILVLILVFWLLPRLVSWWRIQQSAGRPQRRRVSQRARRVETAAAEAAEDDPAFAPDVVKPAAAQLFLAIQTAWDRGDAATLSHLVGPDLFREWQLRLNDFARRGWRNRVEVLRPPNIEYVGLRNAAEDAGDRVVVRVEATLRDYVENRFGMKLRRTGAVSDTTAVREFWMLAKASAVPGMPAGAAPPGGWILLSIEQGAEGEHALDEQIVASPWSDEQRMHDEALVEGAAEDAVPEGTNLAELANLDFSAGARAAALDLSLADGRFAPDILEVAARRAVSAWAEAVDGDDAALNAMAHPEAAHELLHPADPSGRTRLVVRGPQVRQIRIVGLDAAAQPATMTIEVDLEGRRYLEDRRTTEVLAGSQARATKFTERWMMQLDGPEAQPWRIAAVAAPVSFS